MTFHSDQAPAAQGTLLPFGRYRFSFRLDQDARFPAETGSMFRGAFGTAFKQAVCITGMRFCDGCDYQGSCAYFRVFETEISDPGSLWFLRGIKKAPHPYLFSVHHITCTEFRRGEELEVYISLFGAQQILINAFVLAFLMMGKNGLGVNRVPFTLTKVESVTGTDLVPIYQQGGVRDGIILPVSTLSVTGTSGDFPPVVGILLKSQLTLQDSGRVISWPEKLTASHVYRSLARRFFSLAHSFGTEDTTVYLNPVPDGEPIPVLSGAKLSYDEFNRLSNRQEKKLKLGGFRGSFLISVHNALQWQLLNAGMVTAVGKNTVFGSGQYTLFTV